LAPRLGQDGSTGRSQEGKRDTDDQCSTAKNNAFHFCDPLLRFRVQALALFIDAGNLKVELLT
jgi:hypothetical protein